MMRAIATAGLSDVEKSVVKATWNDQLQPKQKHVEWLVDWSREIDLVTMLEKRFSEPHWNVTLKTLLVIHRLMIDGNERFLHDLSQRHHIFSLSNILDSSSSSVIPAHEAAIAHLHTKLIKSYASYLQHKVYTYKLLSICIERKPPQESKQWVLKLSSTDLCKCLPAFLEQFAALVKCAPPHEIVADDLTHLPLPINAMQLLVKDAFRLYSSLTVAMLVVLDKFLEMNIEQTKLMYQCGVRFIDLNEQFKKWASSLDTLGFAQSRLLPDFNVPPSFLQILKEHIQSLQGGGVSNNNDNNNATNQAVAEQEEKKDKRSKKDKKKPKKKKQEDSEGYSDDSDEDEGDSEDDKRSKKTAAAAAPVEVLPPIQTLTITPEEEEAERKKAKKEAKRKKKEEKKRKKEKKRLEESKRNGDDEEDDISSSDSEDEKKKKKKDKKRSASNAAPLSSNGQTPANNTGTSSTNLFDIFDPITSNPSANNQTSSSSSSSFAPASTLNNPGNYAISSSSKVAAPMPDPTFSGASSTANLYGSQQQPTQPSTRSSSMSYNPLGQPAYAYGAPPPPYPAAATPYNAPAYSTPAYGTPAYGTPAYGTPAYGTPAYGTPAYGTPFGAYAQSTQPADNRSMNFTVTAAAPAALAAPAAASSSTSSKPDPFAQLGSFSSNQSNGQKGFDPFA